jgi:hypothetical protein
MTLHPDTSIEERDPRWARLAMAALLVATALLYLVDLGASGWANTFYSRGLLRTCPRHLNRTSTA